MESIKTQISSEIFYYIEESISSLIRLVFDFIYRANPDIFGFKNVLICDFIKTFKLNKSQKNKISAYNKLSEID